MDHVQSRDRGMAEEAIYALDDFRLHHRKLRGVSPRDRQVEHAAETLAVRQAQCLWLRMAREIRTDDLGPARDDLRLLKSKSPEGSPADARGKVADGARPATAL